MNVIYLCVWVDGRQKMLIFGIYFPSVRKIVKVGFPWSGTRLVPNEGICWPRGGPLPAASHLSLLLALLLALAVLQLGSGMGHFHQAQALSPVWAGLHVPRDPTYCCLDPVGAPGCQTLLPATRVLWSSNICLSPRILPDQRFPDFRVSTSTTILLALKHSCKFQC